MGKGGKNFEENDDCFDYTDGGAHWMQSRTVIRKKKKKNCCRPMP